MHDDILSILVVGVLTLAIIASIFLAAFIRLWTNPPVVVINAEGLTLPETFTLIQQRLPAKVETNKPDVIPIPAKVLEYISLESDEWAQESRKRRARALYSDSQDWDIVFRMMQMEDSPLGE